MNWLRPSTTPILISNPHEYTSVAWIMSLEINENIFGLVSISIGSRFATVADTEAHHDLLLDSIKHIVDEISLDGER